MLQKHPLEIHVYMVDEDVHRFYVDEPAELKRFQQQLVPSRLFQQKQFLIAGSFFMAGFSLNDVTRIDLVGSDVPPGHNPMDQREVSEISEREMERRCLPRFTDTKRSEIQANPDKMVESWGEFGMVDGKRVCCHIRSKAGGKLDQRQFIQNLTTGHGFVIERLGGGLIILNPALISRWALYPGLPELPANTWKGHRLDIETDAHPSLVFKKISLKDMEAEDEGEE